MNIFLDGKPKFEPSRNCTSSKWGLLVKRSISWIKTSSTNTEIKYVNKAISDGWGSNMNLYIDEFTSEFSKYIDVEYCLPTAHCTDAIHLAMLALEIGPGDEVIVPDLTWVASASPILYVGAKPVFVDVDPISFL